MSRRVVVAALIAFAMTAIAIRGAMELVGHRSAPPRPDEPNRAAYAMKLTTDGASEVVVVDANGQACGRLAEAPRLQQACGLATITDGAYISAAAYGRINSEEGAPFEAVIWRAWLGDDASVCVAAGLDDGHLGQCQRIAALDRYDVTDGAVSVSLVRSGPVP